MSTAAAPHDPVVPSAADPSSEVHSAAALTGKRRLAFAAYVDERRLPGFLALLRSLALTNPGVCEDFVVLHDAALPAAAADRIRALHPRADLRPGEPGEPAEPGGLDGHPLLAVLGVRGYDTVVAFCADTVVTGPLGELLTLRTGAAATPAPGALVVQRDLLTDAFRARLAAAGPAATPGPHPDAPALALLRAVLGTELAELDGAPFAPACAPEDVPAADMAAAYLRAKGVTHPDLLVHFGTPHVTRTGDATTARRVAAAHIAAGRYQEAVDLMASVRLPLDAAWPHEVYGHALMSVSRYAEARTHLRVATAVPEHAAAAFARLAQIEWVLGDDEKAQQYALAGLDADPGHAPSNNVRVMTAPAAATRAGGAKSKAKADKEGAPRKQLAHVAFYMPHQGNAGDKLLPESVRLAFGSETGPRRWHSVHAHRLFGEAALAEANSRRALVVGGGGLFIPDTAPNGNSAWQWNVSDDVLRRVEVPVIVYAVGFNAFDGQSYRQRRFATALRTLVEKSAFFGLRNHGSIEKVRALLPAHLHDRVRFQPCPTTVTRQLVGGWSDPASREDTVLFNAAYDRAGLRFGHDYGHFLAELAAAVRRIGDRAEVRCVAHAQEDERVVFDLRREHGISLPVVPMYDFDNPRILDVYARTKLVIGMRGHASMIPFGCGTPIVSLISHPKMAYFLADIDRPEWGVSVHDRRLGALLTEKAFAVLDDHEAAVADVHGRQQELWKVTQANAADLRTLVGGPLD
ncbi:polysaccharide pyruvyl transferase family protein [Streptomyces sp. NBC_01198]|uniref:polysaccharide pyruvyl transferase family protein n=1 Tax=Streptomyces sp. NBC_01198 TaxID=2903769 RepID=UPI002E12D7E6|nr:polysaccharide pyruvyl transferase family protein [Streptomyces sp. NBC_01198]